MSPSKVSALVDGLPPPAPETMRQRLTYWQYRAVWEAAARLPAPLAAKVPDRVGAAWHRFGSDAQRQQVRSNLRRVLGGDPDPTLLDETVAAAYDSYTRYWLDSFRLHTMTRDEVLARSTGHNLHLIDDMLADGSGGILATAHLGSWDIGAFFSTQRNWGVSAVAELLEPRRLFDRFVDLRRQAGIEVIPLVRGGDMVGRMADVVARGGLATLLADRALGRRGPVVEFFGEPCRMPAGTAVLARRTGRPVAVGAFLTTGPDSYEAWIESRVDISGLSVHDGTQVVAHELEKIIARTPQQWHVFVRNWLADREPNHPAVVAWREGNAIPDPP